MEAYQLKLVGKSQKKSETGMTKLKILLIAEKRCSIAPLLMCLVPRCLYWQPFLLLYERQNAFTTEKTLIIL